MDARLLSLEISPTEALEAIRGQRRLREARRDAERIRKECQSLYAFVERAWHIVEPVKPFVGGWALREMCRHLEAVTDGRIQFLLINVPPGMMKSLLVSVFWPAWEWGPRGLGNNSFLASSFSQDNVVRDNEKMRRIVKSEWYRTLWPDVLIPRGQDAKLKFQNSQQGFREGRPFASMTGGRADRVIIDDPHSVETAESDVQREETVLLFREAITDRLNDITRSAIVIIMQRLHEADVSGTILALKLPYVHLELPMEFDPARRCSTKVGGKLFFQDPRVKDGDLLFPERFPPSELATLRVAKGEYAYAGQYQQLPVPREGGMFLVEKIGMVDSAPAGGKRVRGWDIAGSERKTSPFTAGVRLNDVEGIIYIEDVKRERAEIDKAERLIVNTAEDDDADSCTQSIPQDPGSSGKSQRYHIARKLGGLNFHFSPETGSKQDRAIPFASQVNAGMVRMVRGDWNAEFLAELRTFPGSKYKDQVDAASRAYSELVRGKGKKRKIVGAEIITPE